MAAFIMVMEDGDVVAKGVTEENYLRFAKLLVKVGTGLYEAEFEAEDQEVPQVVAGEDKGDPGFP